MQNFSVQTGLSLHQALAFCFIRFPSIAGLLPQPFASFPPSPCFPNLVCGTDRLAVEKKNNPVLHCPFKLILCCLQMTEANSTYIKICSPVGSDDFRNLFNAQSWEAIISSSWALTFYRFVYCFSEWKLKQGSSEILRKLVISSLIHLQPLSWPTQLSVLLMCLQFQRHFVKFLNQEADITAMMEFCSIWFVCLFICFSWKLLAL